MEADKATLIDAKAEVQGKLTGTDARILGRFRGELELQGRLTTGEGSHLEARVKAESVEIGGEFEGELTVKKLLLLEKAWVRGNIAAEVLGVREGARLDGAVNAVGAPAAKAPAAEPRPAGVGPLTVGPRPPVKGAAGG